MFKAKPGVIARQKVKSEALDQGEGKEAMSGSVLSEVVTRGILALQAEDCSIRAAVHHRGERGGLVRLQNERFYQFIVWQSILPVWHADVEREEASDLIIRQSDNKIHHFEMKKWMTPSGNTEIAGMRNDVAKLRSRERGYLIVFSANSPEATEKNVADLALEIGGLDVSAKEHRFFPHRR